MRAILPTLTLTGLTAVLASVAAAQPAEREIGDRNIELFVGEQTVISADGVAKYSLGTEGVIDMRLPEDGNEFVVVALNPGTTTILLIMESGRQIRYDVKVQEVRVTERDNIRLDFYFVELNRDSSWRAGIGWPGSVPVTTTVDAQWNLRPAALTSATASVTSTVLPRLDLAQRGGWAKVMRQASVVVANGGSSKFESGGELNFRIESAVASNIQQIQFGSRIEVQPRYDRSTGRLDVRIGAIVSELTDQTTEGLPGRSYTNLDTVVNLELGQSIVLAGIHATTVGRSSEGLPILSQVPVLGFLFGSQTKRETETENLVFIVPSVVQAVTSSKRQRVLEAQRAFADYEGELKGNGETFYRQGMPLPSERQKDGKR